MSGLRVYQALPIEAAVPEYCSQQVTQRRACSRASSRSCCKSEPRRERISLSWLLLWEAPLIFGDVAPDRFRKDRPRIVMLIQEMTRQASLDLLIRTHLGRLACSRGAQSYIVPIYFAYDNNCLYSFSTVGQKIEWMRANPLVCVQADEVVSSQQWMSVIVFGRFEELPDVPEWQSARASAHELLQRKGMWWEPGYVKTILYGTQRPLVPVFYRIHIVQITGHHASPEPGNAS